MPRLILIVVMLALSLAACGTVTNELSPTPVGRDSRPRLAATAEPVATAIVATATSFPPTPRPTPQPDRSVAYLLRHRPAPGTTVEIDAYFSGGGPAFSLAPGPPGQIRCPPIPWSTALTDRPFPGTLSSTFGGRNNSLPADAPYLIATIPEALHPDTVIVPELPFHARLRGHLDDPAQAHCPLADRIFVVEQVVTVYRADPPPGFVLAQLPDDYADWVRYHDESDGYSVAHPPDWTVEPRSDSRYLSTIALRGSQWPRNPIIVRVRPEETPIEGYIPAEPPPLRDFGLGLYWQSGLFTGKPDESQQLRGYTGDRKVGPNEHEVVTLFNAHGRTYELTLRYPVGFDASQPLLSIYAAVVEDFRLDNPPTY
jgi:hypothetical protein